MRACDSLGDNFSMSDNQTMTDRFATRNNPPPQLTCGLSGFFKGTFPLEWSSSNGRQPTTMSEKTRSQTTLLRSKWTFLVAFWTFAGHRRSQMAQQGQSLTETCQSDELQRATRRMAGSPRDAQLGATCLSDAKLQIQQKLKDCEPKLRSTGQAKVAQLQIFCVTQGLRCQHQ